MGKFVPKVRPLELELALRHGKRLSHGAGSEDFAAVETISPRRRLVPQAAQKRTDRFLRLCGFSETNQLRMMPISRRSSGEYRLSQ